MIVAVLVARVMKVTVHDIVRVVAVWHRLVAAPGAVHVVGCVGTARVLWRAGRRVRLANIELVPVRPPAGDMVAVTALDALLVIVVRRRRMAAASRAGVDVARVILLLAHGERLRIGAFVRVMWSASHVAIVRPLATPGPARARHQRAQSCCGSVWIVGGIWSR